MRPFPNNFRQCYILQAGWKCLVNMHLSQENWWGVDCCLFIRTSLACLCTHAPRKEIFIYFFSCLFTKFILVGSNTVEIGMIFFLFLFRKYDLEIQLWGRIARQGISYRLLSHFSINELAKQPVQSFLKILPEDTSKLLNLLKWRSASATSISY